MKYIKVLFTVFKVVVTVFAFGILGVSIVGAMLTGILCANILCTF